MYKIAFSIKLVLYLKTKKRIRKKENQEKTRKIRKFMYSNKKKGNKGKKYS